MLYELTYAELATRRKRRLAYAVLVLVIVVALGFAVAGAREAARQQSTESVKQAIVKGAVRCLAVEGSYPSSVAHLEQNYGLVINHDDYDVTYEWLGDNVPPSVVVRPR